ncbi:MAG: hypothetical protein RLZZ150_1119 [Bacteroidota bacterium]|jgi:DNA-binding response OmpR family regulator
MDERGMSIMLVDDDERYRRSFSEYFRKHGLKIVEVGSAEEAEKVVSHSHVDLAIIDWTLPDTDGVQLCSKLRTLYPEMPLVILTGRVDLDSQLEGYTYGADDYWTKPFPMSLALAKAQAMLRKHTALTLRADRIRMGDIEVDFRTRLVHKNGKRVDLSEKEYGILRTLALEDGAPVRRETLLARVWGYDSVPVTRTVDNYIVALRRKLEIDPARPQYLVTVGGIGYRLNTD